MAGLDPEITRLELERDRLTRTQPGPFKSAALRDTERILEHRRRMAAKRAYLFSQAGEGATVGELADVANARAEAQDLAARMSAAGYTPQQIRAQIAPMYVNPGVTITGKAERRAARKKRREERRAAGKGIFQKIGKALKKGAAFIHKGAAKLNPVLVGGRAAFLDAMRRNIFGLASTLAKKDQAKLRKKWENLGGDYDKLKAAIEKGSGQPVTGLDDYDNFPSAQMPDQVIGVAPLVLAAGKMLLSSGGGSGAAAGAAAGGGGGNIFQKIIGIARPIIEAVLKVFGIKLAPKDQAQLDAVPKSAEGDAVEAQMKDAEDPTSGGGAGFNSGKVPVSLIALAGIAAALFILAPKKK